MSERDLSIFACPNPECSAFGQRGQGNLRLHGWSSKPNAIRCLRCTLCGKNFSERHGTPLYHSPLSPAKAAELAHHLSEGNGLRGTARLCQVSLNTVLRFVKRAGTHAQAFHDQQVRHVHPTHLEADEAWSFVGKKREEL